MANIVWYTTYCLWYSRGTTGSKFISYLEMLLPINTKLQCVESMSEQNRL